MELMYRGRKGLAVSTFYERAGRNQLKEETPKVIPIGEGNIIFFTDLIYDSEKPLSPPALAFTKMVEELKRTLILPSAITTHG
jgi:hypothetical protein